MQPYIFVLLEVGDWGLRSVASLKFKQVCKSEDGYLFNHFKRFSLNRAFHY